MPAKILEDTPGSTKSYDYVRERNDAVNRLDFWPLRDAITVNYLEGRVIEVPQHDGSII
jgi:2-oxoglutarate/2-oxoacid ferredoxin oxidoreductase subunit beta